MRRALWRCSMLPGVAWIAVCALDVRLLDAQQPQTPEATFRESTNLVSVSVRVLDRDGNPVTNLGVGDFKLMEDGAPQVVRHFAVRTYSGVSHAGATDAPSSTEVESPVPSRTFVIAFGRSGGSTDTIGIYPERIPLGGRPGGSRPRTVDAADSVDGMLHLVRDLLLPQDRTPSSPSTARPRSRPTTRPSRACSNGSSGTVRTSKDALSACKGSMRE